MQIWNRCISLSLSCSSLSLSFQETTVSAWVPVLGLDGRSAIDHHVELYFSPPTLEPWSLCLSTEHDTHVGNPKGVWKGQTVDTHYVVPRTNKTHTHTHICIRKTLIPPFKEKPVRLVVQAWGEETFAVLERLCRSGLFSLLCCVSVPSECLRPALSSSSYRLTPPWHLQKKRGGGRYLCVSVYRPLSHLLVPRQHCRHHHILAFNRWEYPGWTLCYLLPHQCVWRL